MKKCPNCERSYGKETSYCPLDGTHLEDNNQKTNIFPGQLLDGKYEIKEPIDLEGNWTVYHGYEVATNQSISIKFHIKPTGDKYTQLLHKLEIAKKVSYPGFVKVIDYGVTSEGLFYIASEYVEGKSLKKIIKEVGGVSLDLSISIMEQVLEILEIAHKNNIFHWNLRPSKIFILKNSSQQFIKIAGLGEMTFPKDMDSNIEGEQPLKNIDNYTAPELFLGKELDQRCDVYSAGVIFYEMITGVSPFPSGIMFHQSRKYNPLPPPMKRIKPHLKIPRKLEKSILKAICWTPSQRYQNIHNFSKAVVAAKQRVPKTLVSVFCVLVVIITLAIFENVRFALFTFLENVPTYLSTEEKAKPKPKKIEKKKTANPLLQEYESEFKKISGMAKKSSNKNMVYISAGKAVIGSANGEDDEKPVQMVEVKAFYIDKTEVTNKEYQAFINATKYKAPPYWKNNRYPQGKSDYAVVEVSWYDAKLYAFWCGKRLPTEVEWERAARGPENVDDIHRENYRWSWGKIFYRGYCNINGHKTLPVGSFPRGKSPTNILDMAGNVWEWTNSWYDIVAKKDRVIRGGSFHSTAYQVRTTYREGFLPLSYRNDIGFRCVKDLE